MKFFYRIMLAAIFMAIASAPVQAQFKIGPRVGLEINKLHFSEDAFKSDNRAGFTGGIEAEFTVPVINLGFDASLMYVRRTAEFMEKQTDIKKSSDYIAIPVNVKYKFPVPVVKPYIFTGPEFAFNTSGRAISEAYRNKKTDVSWNFGFGVELISHLQVGASYGIGLTKLSHKAGITGESADIPARNNYWTVTAAWLF